MSGGMTVVLVLGMVVGLPLIGFALSVAGDRMELSDERQLELCERSLAVIAAVLLGSFVLWLLGVGR